MSSSVVSVAEEVEGALFGERFLRMHVRTQLEPFLGLTKRLGLPYVATGFPPPPPPPPDGGNGAYTEREEASAVKPMGMGAMKRDLVPNDSGNETRGHHCNEATNYDRNWSASQRRIQVLQDRQEVPTHFLF